MPVTACECEQPGYCQRHGCWKNPYLWKLCQRDKKYFDLWEAGQGPGQRPPYVDSPLLDNIDEHVLAWAVGVLATNNAPLNGVEACVRDLTGNGIPDPVVFAQSQTVLSEHVATFRVVRADAEETAWQSWLTALGALPILNPTAQAVVILPENQGMDQGVVSYLAHDLWPDPATGVVLFQIHDPAITEPIGFIDATASHMAEAQAWMFPFDVAELLLDDPDATPTPERSIDEFISSVLAKHNLKAFAYAPHVCAMVTESHQQYDPIQRYNLPGGQVRLQNTGTP